MNFTYTFFDGEDDWEITISYDREPPDYSVGIGPVYNWEVSSVCQQCPYTELEVENLLPAASIVDACDDHWRMSL